MREQMKQFHMKYLTQTLGESVGLFKKIIICKSRLKRIPQIPLNFILTYFKFTKRSWREKFIFFIVSLLISKP